jgi:hypothetical protein
MSFWSRSGHTLAVLLITGLLTACGAEMEGDLPATVISPNSPTPAPALLARSDFDGDAHPDLVVTSQGSISLWFMKVLNNVLNRVSTQSVLSVPADSKVVGSADFDRDGKFDILISNNTSKKLSILRLAGSNGASYQSTLPLRGLNGAVDFAIPSTHVVAGTVDYDFDNDPDILIWNAVAGNDLRILKFQGLQYLGEEVLVDSNNVATGPGPQYLLVGLYDFPSENRWRIFWQAKTTHPTAGTAGTIYRWSMTGNQRVAGTAESGIMMNHLNPMAPINLKASPPWVVAGVQKYPGDASFSMILQNPTVQSSTVGDLKYLRWRFNANLECIGFEYVDGVAFTVGETPPSIQPN